MNSISKSVLGSSRNVQIHVNNVNNHLNNNDFLNNRFNSSTFSDSSYDVDREREQNMIPLNLVYLSLYNNNPNLVNIDNNDVVSNIASNNNNNQINNDNPDNNDANNEFFHYLANAGYNNSALEQQTRIRNYNNIIFEHVMGENT